MGDVAAGWQERYIAPNGDGTYSIAPLYYFGRVYIVSQVDKERFVAAKQRSAKLSWIPVAAILFAYWLWGVHPVVLSVVPLAVIVADTAYGWSLVSHGRSVPYSEASVFAARFGGSRRRDRFLANVGSTSAWALGLLLAISLFFVVLVSATIGVMFYRGEMPGIGMVAFLLMFAFGVWMSWGGLRYRRKLRSLAK